MSGQFTYDLSNLGLPYGTYDISVKVKAEDFLDSRSSNVVEYTTSLLPEKGNLISMNINGTNEIFRVLKINDAIAEVFGNLKSKNSIFASSGHVYAGSELDVSLNTNFYNTLTETAKAAIVDKTFEQDKWFIDSSEGNPVYQATRERGTDYVISLSSATFGESITRHIYALSIQDVIDFLGATPEMTVEDTVITSENLQQQLIFPSHASTWLRSAVDDGTTQYGCYLSAPLAQFVKFNASQGFQVRPAFQIDLSKIEWSFYIE